MFKLARGLARHKIGVVALIAFAVVMFSGGEEAPAGPSSPWSKNAPVAAAPADTASGDDGSITGKLGSYANSAGEYAAEKFLGDKDLNPVKLGEDTVGRFDEANSAFAQANGNQAE
jgi:hypothetical protein